MTSRRYVADKKLEELQAVPTVQCACEQCRDACTQKPGWFTPGQVELVAKHLGITLQELFDTKLMIDWIDPAPGWTVGTRPVFILSPAVTTRPAGQEAGYVNTGRCVFLKRGLCSIHQVKPSECKAWSCQLDGAADVHKLAGQSWERPDHQQQIETLLGHQPSAMRI